MDQFDWNPIEIGAGYTAHVWCAVAYFQATACIYPQQKSGWL